MSTQDRSSFDLATTKLQEKLDHGVRKLVAQNFQHAIQDPRESVSDFIHHLEKLFQRACGIENLTVEMRDTLLHGQLSDNGDPYSFLESSSDEEAEENVGVRQIRVKDNGSVTQCVKLFLQGVPVYGIIDSSADITIIGGQLFKHVALAACLKKKDFTKLDKTLKTYGQKPFTLVGRIDLDVVFEDKAMWTPIHILPKMDAYDQLLLSKGVCQQLGILSYHDKVERWRGGKSKHSSDDANQGV